MKLLLKIIILFLFSNYVYAEDIVLGKNDISFINNKSNDFITNINFDNLKNSVLNEENKSYNCIDFKNMYHKVYSSDYMNKYCFYKANFDVSRNQGFDDATKTYKDQVYVNKVKEILNMENYTTEGVNDILYQLNNINPINSEDINQCKYITNPYSSSLPNCLSKIYTTANEGSNYKKYMSACDTLYSNKKYADICILNLGKKSFDPFDRVETKCLVEHYTSYTDNQGKVLRRLDTGPYYQCLGDNEHGQGFELWKSQMGYREGYTAGLYILKSDDFDFLKNKND